ncbi:hypothetical protein OROMI_002831 [Orobanche minor]
MHYLQADSWFLHAMLQVCYLFSCYVCFSCWILHGIALLREEWDADVKMDIILCSSQDTECRECVSYPDSIWAFL